MLFRSDGNGYIDDVYGINSITNTGNPIDDMATTYHGTHVSGTIGGSGNNALGVAGVAWNVKLMGLKFLDSTGSGSTSNALTLSQAAATADPANPRVWQIRARMFNHLYDYRAAATNLTMALSLEPSNPAVLFERGTAHFRSGNMTNSVADLDRYNELQPGQAPHNWQRGIALYYAGRYADGRRQFEIHQTVNSNDVENAVWHFLCTARERGLAKARESLIPIQGDSRVPMAEVHQLFAGKLEPADVLAAARRGTPAPDVLRQHEFYAHLYLGIFFEATGDGTKAREHILEASRRADPGNYMGDVARIHCQIRGWCAEHPGGR